METPVLLLVFNRPAATRQVLEQLRRMQVRRLYVSADGARAHKAGEAQKVAQTRQLIERVDWDCDVTTRFLDENLGCKYAVSSGITWFFEQVEAGIILEDDCIPHASFFEYASQLLETYKGEPRVMHIAGSNAMGNAFFQADQSYYYTPFTAVWGWATWRRAWQHLDLEVKNLPNDPDWDILKEILPSRLARKYYIEKFKASQTGTIDSWAYPWQFSVLRQKGIGIIPKYNLIQNVGFGEQATHTSDNKALPTQALSFPLVSPSTLAYTDPAFNQAYFYKTQKKRLPLLARSYLPEQLLQVFR